MGKVFSVCMNKGGVGKSTLVTNLAAIASEHGRTLIIDTDGQGNCALSFGFVPNDFHRSVYQLFLGEKELGAVQIQVAPNLHLVAANDDMNFLEFEVLPNLEIYPNAPFSMLIPAIQQAKREFDFIFVDSPPHLGLVTGNVLAISDELILPFDPETFGVQGFIRVLEGIEEFQEKQGVNVQISGVVGMKVNLRTNLHREMLSEARDFCSLRGIKMFKTLIPRSIRFSNAVAYEQKPAVLVDNSEIVRSYRYLFQEVFSDAEIFSS